MNEHDGTTEQNLGISRRTLLRRGAVVGGTLMWTAPMVKSLTPAAFGATQGPSPGKCSACYCWNGTKNATGGPATVVTDPGAPTPDFGQQDGPPATSTLAAPGSGLFSADDCDAWCKARGWDQSQYCTGTTACSGTAGGSPCGGPGQPSCAGRGAVCS